MVINGVCTLNLSKSVLQACLKMPKIVLTQPCLQHSCIIFEPAHTFPAGWPALSESECISLFPFTIHHSSSWTSQNYLRPLSSVLQVTPSCACRSAGILGLLMHSSTPDLQIQSSQGGRVHRGLLSCAFMCELSTLSCLPLSLPPETSSCTCCFPTCI